MPHRTNIEWADYSSNCLRARDASGNTGWACAKVSPGCLHCYSETLNGRLGTKLDYSQKSVREVEHYLDEKELRHILNFRPKPPHKNGSQRPTVFPFDMTDLFGEWVPFETIDRIMAAFALRPDVDFQVLTKRPERMAEYMQSPIRRALVGSEILNAPGEHHPAEMRGWPLHNLWLGTSCENQAMADERIPHLAKCPAAVRFVSAEPLLEEIDFSRYLQDAVKCDFCGPSPETLLLPDGGNCYENFCAKCYDDDPEAFSTICGCDPLLDWVIFGCESGPKRRPCELDWIRSGVEQCRAAGVAAFVKQVSINGRVSHDPAEWPEDLRVREWPTGPAEPTNTK